MFGIKKLKRMVIDQDNIIQLLEYESKELRHLINNLIVENEYNKTEQCYICKKYDFLRNMVGLDEYFAQDLGIKHISIYRPMPIVYVHADCAKIVRSDDGNGWCKAKTHAQPETAMQHPCKCEPKKGKK